MRQFVVTVCALLFVASLGRGLPSEERDRRCGDSNPIVTTEETTTPEAKVILKKGRELPSEERDRQRGGSNPIVTTEETTTLEATTVNPRESLCKSQGRANTYCVAKDLCLFVGQGLYDEAKKSCQRLSDKPLLISLAIFPCNSEGEVFWELGVERNGQCGRVNDSGADFSDCEQELFYMCDMGFPF